MKQVAAAPILRLVRLTSSRSRMFREAFAIYEATIPRAEQKTRAEIVAGLKSPDAYVWAFLSGSDVAGLSILHAVRPHNMLLLEYLAISPAFQGRGAGSDLFAQSFAASRTGPDTLLLIEVDSERDEIDGDERGVRLRRKQFYRRLGCREVHGFDYILPLDHFGPAPRMSLLVKGAASRTLGAARLRAAIEAVYVNVYGCAPGDPRLAAMFAAAGPAFELM